MSTKSIVPRANNEGSLGIPSKQWGAGHFGELKKNGENVAVETQIPIVASQVEVNEGTSVNKFLTPNTLSGAIQFSSVTGSIAKIPGILAWYSATDIKLTDGATVSSWSDRSGNGYNLSLRSGAIPKFVTSGIGGLPSVRFDNTGGMLTTAGVFTGSNCPAVTVFVVSRASATSTTYGGHPFGLGGSETFLDFPQAIHVMENHRQGMGVWDWIGGWNVPHPTIRHRTIPYRTQITAYRYAAGAQSSWRDGCCLAKGSEGTQLALSGEINVGCGCGDITYGSFIGLVSEVVVFNRALTDQEMMLVYRSLEPYRENKPRIWTIGDSILDDVNGAFDKSPADRLKTVFPEYVAYNTAEGGSKINDWATGIYSGSFSGIRSQDIVWVWGGGNDLVGGRTLAQLQADIQTVCSNVRYRKAKVVVTALLPRTDLNNTTRLSFNSWLLANYSTFADGLLDPTQDQVLGQTGQYTNTTYYLPDQVHPTDAAYDRLMPLFSAGLAAVIYGSNGVAVSGRASAQIDFGDVASGGVSSAFTVAIPGCLVGDLVLLGIPSDGGSGIIKSWVSAPGTVSLRAFADTALTSEAKTYAITTLRP